MCCGMLVLFGRHFVCTGLVRVVLWILLDSEFCCFEIYGFDFVFLFVLGCVVLDALGLDFWILGM